MAGFTFVETCIAVALVVVIVSGLLVLIQGLTKGLKASRERMTAQRMAELGISKLKNIPFYQLFDMDSSSASYGLAGTFNSSSLYPSKKILDDYLELLQENKCDRFTVAVTFLRRDASDVNGNGMTSDLIAFQDANADGIDDNDSTIRYNNQNSDGDYYDTFISTAGWPYVNTLTSEVPSTNLRQLVLRVYRRGAVVAEQTTMVALGQFTGQSLGSAEGHINLMIATPAANSFLYQYVSVPQQSSQDLAITKAYPASYRAYRADVGGAMTVAGFTEPLALVYAAVNSPSNQQIFTAAADRLFSGNPISFTTSLSEGVNYLVAYSSKATSLSPTVTRMIILDTRAPQITSPTPTNNAPPADAVRDRRPLIGAYLTDVITATTAVSGICPDVITMKLDGAVQAHTYNPTTGFVRMVDGATGLSPLLSNTSAYNVVLEGGDRAHYKVTSSWDFTVLLSTPDASAPTIGSWAGSDTEVSVVLLDPETGVDPLTITLTLDGSGVISSSNVGPAYDPGTGLLTYRASSPLAAGSHSATVTVSNFEPSGPLSNSDTYNFTVP